MGVELVDVHLGNGKWAKMMVDPSTLTADQRKPRPAAKTAADAVPIAPAKPVHGALATLNATPGFQQLQSPAELPEVPVMAPVQRLLTPAEAEKEQAREKEAEESKAKTPLKKVAAPTPRKASDVNQKVAAQVYGEKPAGSGRPDPNRLNLVPGEATIERTPGRPLSPEMRRYLGLDPYEMEDDPDAPMLDTWGNADRPQRKKLNEIEKRAELEGMRAGEAERRAIEAEKAGHVGRLDLLKQQADGLDTYLGTVAERRKRIADLHAAAQLAGDEARKVEPRTHEQVWQSKGGLARAMGMLAVAIGGYTAGLGGGRNEPWEMIQKELDDAVQDERAKAERADKKASDKQSDYEQALALYGDPEAAELQTKIRKLESVQGMLDEKAALKGLDEGSASRIAGMQQKGHQSLLQMYDDLHQRIVGTVDKEQVTLKPAGAVQKAAGMGGGGGGLSLGRGAGAPYGMSPKEWREMVEANRAITIKLPDGSGVKFVRDAKVREATQRKLNAAHDMVQALKQVQIWRADKSNTIPWSEMKGKIASAMGTVVGYSKEKDNLGALDEGLIRFANTKFGAPEDFTLGGGDEIDGKLQQQITMLQQEMQGVVDRDLDDSPLDVTEGGITPTGVEK